MSGLCAPASNGRFDNLVKEMRIELPEKEATTLKNCLDYCRHRLRIHPQVGLTKTGCTLEMVEELLDKYFPSQTQKEKPQPPKEIDMDKIITFDKSALKEICKMLNVPYDKNIIAFTAKGAITNICDLITPKETELRERIARIVAEAVIKYCRPMAINQDDIDKATDQILDLLPARMTEEEIEKVIYSWTEQHFSEETENKLNLYIHYLVNALSGRIAKPAPPQEPERIEELERKEIKRK